jgi:hypothetical protein
MRLKRNSHEEGSHQQANRPRKPRWLPQTSIKDNTVAGSGLV